MLAPPAGEISVVVARQRFLNECPLDQGDGVPVGPSARTRHQYVPFGAVLTSVARVFFVRKSSLPAPSTGELKPGSAATWNSYSFAPETGLQAKAGIASTTAPLPGAVGTGVAGGPAAAAPTRNNMSTTSTAGMAIRPIARAGARVIDGDSSCPTSPRPDYPSRARGSDLPKV